MVLLSWLLACGLKAPPVPLVEPPTVTLGEAGEPVRLQGVCEPRAALMDERGRFVVGDAGISAKRVSVQTNGRKASPVRWPQETALLDVAGATTLGQATYWVGSHSLGKGPRDLLVREEAGSIQSMSLRPEGDMQAWTQALSEAPSCLDCAFPPGTESAGGNKGGLRIGGLAGANERLWVGLQSPLSTTGQALVMVLDDKRSFATDKTSFQDAWALDLGQRGVLAMEYSHELDSFLMVAGPASRTPKPPPDAYVLVAWRPGAQPVILGPAPKVKGGVPSALVLHEQSLWLLYDEGARYRRKHDKWNRPAGQKCTTLGKQASATALQIPLEQP